MDKKELRKKYIKIRKEIKNKEEKSIIIQNKIMNLEIYKKAKVICLYSNLIDEVSTSLLIKESLKTKTVLLPKVINDNEMIFVKITSLNDLQKGTYNIMEPISNLEFDKNQIDLMIIPGIVFDKEKNRIGFGKGYYDKYLHSLKKVYTIGICFNNQVLESSLIKTDKNDVKLSSVISEDMLL